MSLALAKKRIRGIRCNQGPRFSRRGYDTVKDRDGSKDREEPGDVHLFIRELKARSKRYPEEQIRLRVAMVETVVEDLASEHPLTRRRAVEWINETVTGWTFGVEGLAEILDVEPDAIRRALLDRVRRS